MGNYVAVSNDPGAGPMEAMDAMDAMTEIVPPGEAATCPERAPDSEGLPLPDDEN